MEIIVEGVAQEYITPNQIILNLNFKTNGNTYENVLNDGVRSVENFINEVLIKYGFKKEDLKTRNFVISEETRYDNVEHKNIFIGYSYNQQATLRFDYNKEILANIMVDLSKINNAPICYVDFSVKNEKQCRRQIIAKAYNDAYEQALAISEASGKKLIKCAKVDFKPFNTNYNSYSSFGSDMMRMEKTAAVGNIVNTFTPEDIEVKETLYCLWIAE